MHPRFSEFSYGYAAIKEAEVLLSGVYKAAGHPVLPSLLLEEQLGWDVHVPTTEYALFLQFKKGEFISRRAPKPKTWHGFPRPHYRFSVDTDDHQYLALLDLEAWLHAEGVPGDVLYVAPCFHTNQDFDDAYAQGKVLDRSALVGPSEFDPWDGEHHHVTDLTGRSKVLSEPRDRRKPMSWATAIAQADDAARSGRRSLAMRELEAALLRSGERVGRPPVSDENVGPARRAHRLAASLGCGLVLLSEDPGLDVQRVPDPQAGTYPED